MISLNRNFKPKFNVYFYLFIFFGTSSLLALIILSPETVELNVTKSYILVDVVGVLAWPALLCGDCENNKYFVKFSFQIFCAKNFSVNCPLHTV